LPFRLGSRDPDTEARTGTPHQWSHHCTEPPGQPVPLPLPAWENAPAFTAKRLPKGLTLDRATGIITGVAPAPGEYEVTLQARNNHGLATRKFRLVSGDKLALTPPMGWNHWYAHYDRVTDTMMREAADVMISSGMADVGYNSSTSTIVG